MYNKYYMVKNKINGSLAALLYFSAPLFYFLLIAYFLIKFGQTDYGGQPLTISDSWFSLTLNGGYSDNQLPVDIDNRALSLSLANGVSLLIDSQYPVTALDTDEQTVNLTPINAIYRNDLLTIHFDRGVVWQLSFSDNTTVLQPAIGENQLSDLSIPLQQIEWIDNSDFSFLPIKQISSGSARQKGYIKLPPTAIIDPQEKTLLFKGHDSLMPLQIVTYPAEKTETPLSIWRKEITDFNAQTRERQLQEYIDKALSALTGERFVGAEAGWLYKKQEQKTFRFDSDAVAMLFSQQESGNVDLAFMATLAQTFADYKPPLTPNAAACLGDITGAMERFITGNYNDFHQIKQEFATHFFADPLFAEYAAYFLDSSLKETLPAALNSFGLGGFTTAELAGAAEFLFLIKSQPYAAPEAVESLLRQCKDQLLRRLQAVDWRLYLFQNNRLDIYDLRLNPRVAVILKQFADEYSQPDFRLLADQLLVTLFHHSDEQAVAPQFFDRKAQPIDDNNQLHPEHVYRYLVSAADYPGFTLFRSPLNNQPYVVLSSDGKAQLSFISNGSIEISFTSALQSSRFFSIYGLNRSSYRYTFKNISWPVDINFFNYNNGLYYNRNISSLFGKLMQTQPVESLLIAGN